MTMPAAPLRATPTKMSFAKVAASAGKENVALTSFAKVAASVSPRDSRKQTTEFSTQEMRTDEHRPTDEIDLSNGSSLPVNLESHRPPHDMAADSGNEAILVDAVKALYVRDPNDNLVANGSGSIKMDKSALDTVSHDDPYRADSSSELGTKPPSLDGKSITSGTAFALDEKESLRPDDSASVKAAADDDDTFSGVGSIVAGSRFGSEAAARAYRSQYFDIADRRATASQDQSSQGIATPQSGASGQQVSFDAQAPPLDDRGTEAFNLFYSKNPDEKLLEALESPKDRMFLLRSEQDVIEFVKHSKEPFIDLPPCNSFCRMLTHKLADYYHLTHQVDAVAGAVRIFRTPFCRLPEPLAALSTPSTTANTPPSIPTMKIMRRDGGTGPSPSKAASETGSEAKDKTPAMKEKLSREDREAAYNKARERIFGNSEKTAESSTDGDANDMSRSSSVSAKEKPGTTKRSKMGKQRRDDTDSFDVRSQYTPYFAPQQQPAGWSPTPQYGTAQVQQRFGAAMQPVYHPVASPPFANAPPQFNPSTVPSGMPQFNPMNQFPPGQQPPYQGLGVPPMNLYGPPGQSASQPWPPSVYQGAYPGRAPMAVAPPIPYAYGKLPGNSNPTDPKSQHPIPGSYNRHAFNPKTQSFVPGTSGSMPPTLAHGSPHLPYNGYATPPQQYPSNMGFSMVQPTSNNNAMPSYHASPHLSTRQVAHQGMPPGGSGGTPHANYGHAVGLPPKPPPAT